MIRIEKTKRALCALLLSLVPSACEMGAHPVSSARAEPVPMSVNTVGWPDPAPSAIADGNVEMYY